MKLWLLQFVDGFRRFDETGKYYVAGYTHTQGFVIRAESEEIARQTAASSSEHTSGPWWMDAEATTCVELLQDGEAGIVLADEPSG